MQENEFLLEVMRSMNSSLELPAAITNTFFCLQKYFPLEAISFHKFLPEDKAIQTLFWVNEQGFRHIEKSYPLTDEEFIHHRDLEKMPTTQLLLFSQGIARAFMGRALIIHTQNKNPWILASPLCTQNGKTIGRIMFFSKENCVFTEEHVERFNMIKEIFGLIMANLNLYHKLLVQNNTLSSENKMLNKKLASISQNTIIGTSPVMQKLLKTAETLAKTELPVLILGETGTGKELLADYIQARSGRADKPFVKVNCGALPESLIDSELFGSIKGAFTGAFENKKGYFEQADGGTLFLDEVGELSLQAQVRFLRVLQFGLMDKVGSPKPLSVNVRIIAATNRNLEAMMKQGSFRQDLFYRLQAFPLHLPPLRERKEDIPAIARHIVQKIAHKFSLPVYPLKKECLEKMYRYAWHGNIREMENIIERAMILNTENSLCISEFLPADQAYFVQNQDGEQKQSLKRLIQECLLEMGIDQSLFEKRSFYGQHSETTEFVAGNPPKSLDEIKKEQILHALRVCGGKISGKQSAAEFLGLNPNTLRKRMEKYGISIKNLKF